MVKRKKLKIQSLTFDRRYYPTKYRVRMWLRKNPEYKILRYKINPIEKQEKIYKVAQREYKYFKKSTFKTINLNKTGTIKAIVGEIRLK